MRRILTAVTGALLAIGVMAAPALAEPPVHERDIVKDAQATVPVPGECSGPATTLDLTFHLQAHTTFTSTTFHFTGTVAGTWVARDANGVAVASGHFASHSSTQGPGEPTLAVTDATTATGRTMDGQLTNFHFVSHLTVTPNGDVQVDFGNARCTP